MTLNDINKYKKNRLFLRCPKCNMLHSKTDLMNLFDIKRIWQELVYQKDLINAQEIHLCCGVELEYYIGNKLAREILF